MLNIKYTAINILLYRVKSITLASQYIRLNETIFLNQWFDKKYFLQILYHYIIIFTVLKQL